MTKDETPTLKLLPIEPSKEEIYRMFPGKKADVKWKIHDVMKEHRGSQYNPATRNLYHEEFIKVLSYTGLPYGYSDKFPDGSSFVKAEENISAREIKKLRQER